MSTASFGKPRASIRDHLELQRAGNPPVDHAAQQSAAGTPVLLSPWRGSFPTGSKAKQRAGVTKPLHEMLQDSQLPREYVLWTEEGNTRET